MRIEKNYNVYMHRLKKDNRVYIGITKQNLEKRWQRGLGYVHSTNFYNAIQKYGWENFDHIVLFENLSKKEAEQKEMELIKLYNSNDERYGFNMTNGGFHPIMTEEQKRKISNTEKGKKVSQETKYKLSKNIKKYYEINGTTENMKKYYNSVIKPVLCIETGKIYYGQKKLKEEGFNPAMVNSVCNHKRKTTSNYHWKFYYEEEI